MSTIINDKMKAFEVIEDEKLADVTKTIAQTVSEGIMNSVTNQMDKKFDDYMSKILTAIDKPKTEPNVTPTQTQQFQNPYFTTQQRYSNQITP